MNEKEFTAELIVQISPAIQGAHVKSGMSVLYEMPIDDDGVLHMGVDADSGEAIRGGGTGFEQDILIYEDATKGQTTVIPRVIVEIKFGGVTTHDAIVYSQKAESIKRIYPFTRYGMIIGNFKTIPGRVLRHGRHFDFVVALRYPFAPDQIQQLTELLREELSASRRLGAILKGRTKPRVVHKSFLMKE